MLIINDAVAAWVSERSQAYPDFAALYQRVIDTADHYPDTELVVDHDQLGAQIDPRVVKKPFVVDFNDYRHRLHRIQHQQWQGEFLLQALGKAKKHTLIDATAGFGRDSFLLAAYGHKVQACEANPLIALLLYAGLHKSYEDERVAATCQRIKLMPVAAQTLRLNTAPQPTVCYLDPMFQSDRSGQVKNEKFAQILQHLSINFEAKLTTLPALLSWAALQAFSIILVKQSTHDPNDSEKIMNSVNKTYFLSQKSRGKGFILSTFTLMSA